MEEQGGSGCLSVGPGESMSHSCEGLGLVRGHRAAGVRDDRYGGLGQQSLDQGRVGGHQPGQNIQGAGGIRALFIIPKISCF